VAVFQFRRPGVLVSETGVPASAPLNSGWIYAEINPPVNTGLAIANPNNAAATINFTFTDASGKNFGVGNLTLAANAQLAGFLDQPPFNSPVPLQGTFTFQSSQPVGVMALRGLTNERGEILMSTLPVVDTSAGPVSRTQVVQHFADGQGWTTQIVVVNPTSSPIAGNLRFANPDGSTASLTIAGQTDSSFPYSLAAGSSQKLTTSGGSAITTTGTVRVVPSSGVAPTPLVILSYRARGVTISEAGEPVTSGTALRMYVESSGPSGQPGNIQSGVAVANLSSSATSVTFEIQKLDGSIASSPISVSFLPGSGQTFKLLSELFPGLPNPFRGLLRITALSPGVSVANIRIHYNERTEFLITTLPPSVETNAAPSNVLLFPHLADGAGFTTQFILFSGTAGQSASGTLRVFDINGHPQPWPALKCSRIPHQFSVSYCAENGQCQATPDLRQLTGE
jgi:hypothetical protein